MFLRSQDKCMYSSFLQEKQLLWLAVYFPLYRAPCEKGSQYIVCHIPRKHYPQNVLTKGVSMANDCPWVFQFPSTFPVFRTCIKLFLFQVCYLYVWFCDKWHFTNIAMYALVSQGMYWRLVDEVFHMSLVYGTSRCCSSMFIWNNLEIW